MNVTLLGDIHAALEALLHEVSTYLIERLVGLALLVALGREGHQRRRLHEGDRHRAHVLALEHHAVAVVAQEAVATAHQRRPRRVEGREVLALVRLDQRHHLGSRHAKLHVRVLNVFRPIVADYLHLCCVSAARLFQTLRVLIPTHTAGVSTSPTRLPYDYYIIPTSSISLN